MRIASLSFDCLSCRKDKLQCSTDPSFSFSMILKTLPRVMSSTRGTPRFGDGPMTESNIHVRRVGHQNLEYVRKAHRRVPSWCQKDSTLANYQIHQTAVSMPFQSTEVMRTTSSMEPSSIQPTSVTQTGSSATKKIMDAWTTSIMARSLAK